jgi:ATP-dependent helicase/DNAse subunit B
MPQDKFSAVWVSHSSMSDFLKCPRAYYLKNVYKDPQTRHKIALMSPSLALGQAVHEVLESLSVIATDQRFKVSLQETFQQVWKRLSGKQGGFTDIEQENFFKQRGENMLRKVIENPGPLERLAVKINMDLPHYWLSETENIILCGKLDWLEYVQDLDKVNIIDFKTGRNEEDGQSLQLPIYYLLATHTQKRPVYKAFYWYLDTDSGLIEKDLPDPIESEQRVLELAKKIKLARKLSLFKCPKGTGCFACKPYEAILRGEAELIGTRDQRTDLYILPSENDSEDQSIIL